MFVIVPYCGPALGLYLHKKLSAARVATENNQNLSIRAHGNTKLGRETRISDKKHRRKKIQNPVKR